MAAVNWGSAGSSKRRRFGSGSLQQATPTKSKVVEKRVELKRLHSDAPGDPDDEVQQIIDRVSIADILGGKDTHVYTRRTIRTRIITR